MNTNLDPTQRLEILNAAESALRKACPQAFTPNVINNLGQASMLQRHLDQLIEIVRRTSAQTIEPFLAEMIDDLCSTCAAQEPSAVCPLRLEGKCVLFAHARVIRGAIADALRGIEDPQYMAAHPDPQPSEALPA